MIPVNQTKFHPEGNCLAACIASILGFPIQCIPDILKMDNDWKHHLSLWAKWIGYEIKFSEEWPHGYSIAIGDSPRGDWPHAIVYYDYNAVHDPYPGHFGFNGEPIYFIQFEKVDDGSK